MTRLILCFVLAALAGCSAMADSGDITNRKIYLVGASFEHVDGSIQDKPHTLQHLQALAAGHGDVVVGDGRPGDFVANWYDPIQIRGGRTRNADFPDYRIHACVLGLSGEQIADGIEHESTGQYETLPKIHHALDLMQQTCRRVYAIVPPPIDGLELGWIRQHGWDESNWEPYRSAWIASVGARADVTLIDAYAGWRDSKELCSRNGQPPFCYAPYGDWHLTSESARVAAARIYEQILADFPRR